VHESHPIFVVESESSYKNLQIASSHCIASSNQCRVKWNLTFFPRFFSLQNGAQRNKNGAQCCFCSFATTLFWSKFLVRAVFNWFLSFIAKQFHKSRLTLMQWLYRFAFHIQPKNYQTWKWTSVWINRAAFSYFDDLDLIISAQADLDLIISVWILNFFATSGYVSGLQIALLKSLVQWGFSNP